MKKLRTPVVVMLVAGCAVALAAQAPARIATTAEALSAYAVFFNGRSVAISHALADAQDPPLLAGTAKPVYIIWRQRPTRTEGEIRGEFWDLGRMQEGDPRFSTYDLGPIVAAGNNGRWPVRDRLFVLLGATIAESQDSATPTVRGLALAPERFENRSVTITGRFRGANLYGDLPAAPGKSRWDFVLQAGDGAIWVSGLRPRGKDFDLSPTARVDTGRWLEVTGMVRRDGPLAWIEATRIGLATAQEEAPVVVPAPVIAPEPPPTVIFSAPVQEDTEVELASPVRLQFSRDMSGASFTGRVVVKYVGRVPPGATPPDAPAFTARYEPGTRALEIRFKEPLARFQTVAVELLEGITASDGTAMAPWTLTFSTGGGLDAADGPGAADGRF